MDKTEILTEEQSENQSEAEANAEDVTDTEISEKTAEKEDIAENDTKAQDNEVSEDDYSFDSETMSLISSAIAQKKEKAEEERKEQRRKKLRIIAISSGAVIIVLLAIYIGGWAATMGGFLPNTYINGIYVGKMSIDEACTALEDECSSVNITVTGRNGFEQVITAQEFDYSYDVRREVQELFRNVNHAAWIASYFSDTFYETEAVPTYSEDKLKSLLKTVSWGSVETEDAQLIHGDSGYYISDEVYGDKADSDKAVEYVLSQVKQGNFDIDLEAGECYSEPQVVAADLTERLELLNTQFNYVITIDFDYTKEVLSGSRVYEWMTDGGELDKSQVEDYVSYLADKYDTFMTVRKFNTTNRGTITINQGRYSTGQYGWWMDQEKTVNKLLECIEEGKSTDIEPEYVVLDTGYTYKGFESARFADGDIGNTYIEVDLSAQHMWYYEDGEIKFETDQIVSGKASDPKRKTPEGIYSVYTKETGYTMVAADGSYTSYCSYFMRISFEGIGFHDLSRSAYGGNIYLTNGSHGCINMKYDEVKQLYEMVERGTPVILYY